MDTHKEVVYFINSGAECGVQAGRLGRLTFPRAQTLGRNRLFFLAIVAEYFKQLCLPGFSGL